MQGSPGTAKCDINLPVNHLLTDEEFRDLLIRYRQNADREAKNTLIQRNLRLVMSVAQRFTNRGELDDLFQIGCIGLMKAIDKFDISFPVKFSTYAVPVIIGEIKQHLRDDGLIKVSRNLKEMATKIDQIRQQLAGNLGQEPTLAELETATGFSREEITSAMEATYPVNSLQAIIHDDDGDGLSRENLVGDEEAHLKWLEHYALKEIIEKLPPRLRLLIELRFFQDKTQAQVAERFGVSQVQICRLEKETMYKLRELYLGDHPETRVEDPPGRKSTSRRREGRKKMANECSFDVVSKVDMQEVDNAVNQTLKEINQRFDFRDTKTEVVLTNQEIKVVTADDYKLKSVVDVLQTKLIKRGVSIKNLEYSKVESASGGAVRQLITIKQGIETEKAKQMVKDVKGLNLKVQAQIMNDQVRVAGKNKDDLQAVIQLLKDRDYGVALQFVNYR